MREIKFRAWDKKRNRMFSILGPGYFDAEYQDFNFKVDFVDEDLRWELDSDEWELMQYTGLKDKNGKEIYEGDLVECYTTNGKKVYYRPQLVEIPEWYRLIWDETNTEVIGNIYEKPGLL